MEPQNSVQKWRLSFFFLRFCKNLWTHRFFRWWHYGSLSIPWKWMSWESRLQTLFEYISLWSLHINIRAHPQNSVLIDPKSLQSLFLLEVVNNLKNFLVRHTFSSLRIDGGATIDSRVTMKRSGVLIRPSRDYNRMITNPETLYIASRLLALITDRAARTKATEGEVTQSMTLAENDGISYVSILSGPRTRNIVFISFFFFIILLS